MLQRIAVLSILSIALASCQSSMLRSFEKVHPGMDKHQVLEALGNPSSTTRLHGKDRWIYRFYEGNIRFDKEVHFLDGMAVYIGDAWTPEPGKTAAAVDSKNEELNEKAQVEASEHSKKNSKAYEDYQSEARNADKVRYMPRFKNIE
ncbi:MAG TPA: outer membrane protein assembly factor BamE [Pseudobdellovibrionaceae bacterium]|nr:outer membrane protein assembly factor BamE [Pseudobdellovibrionaceae bacterium]